MTTGPVHRESGVRMCPLCEHELTSYNTLKNGKWVFEPVENFGITNADEGQVCMEWDARRVRFYYHSPEALERGQLTRQTPTDVADVETVKSALNPPEEGQ